MKKFCLSLSISALLFTGFAGSAYADSTLESKVNELMGIRYKYSGTTTKGFDCSGFTMYVFDSLGVDLPHSSKSQSKLGTTVKKDELIPGDLVFFNTSGKDISHVGVYIGDGKFAHASTNKGVIKSSLSEAYYAKRYVTAKRVLSNEAYQQYAVEKEAK